MQRLGIQSAGVLPPEEAIGRIEVVGLFVEGGGLLLIGRAQDHELVQVLERPAAFHKFRRKPVEQFRMRRLVAPESEIARRSDEALAEMVMPEAIHEDARRERIVAMGDPLGQRTATLAFRRGGVAKFSSRMFGPSKARREDFLRLVFGIAPLLHAHAGRFFLTDNRIDLRRLQHGSEGGLQFGNFCFHLLPLELIRCRQSFRNSLRLQPCITEEKQIVPDAITAIRGHEREEFYRGRNQEVDGKRFRFLHPGMIYHAVRIEIDREVTKQIGRHFACSKTQGCRESQGLKSMHVPDGLKIKSDAAIGMQSQHRMTFAQVIHTLGLRMNLGGQWPIANGIP